MSTLLSEHRQPIIAPKLLDRVPAQRSTSRTSARHEPVAACPSPPVVTPRASWSLILGLIVATLHEWRRRRAERRELASLDTRMCATSASIPAPSTTRQANGSGGPLAIGEIDRRGGEPSAIAVTAITRLR